MVGVIMVAEEFGTGRGTLFDILELLFGKEYVVPCTFGELTGTSAAARFNARLADALFVVVNEAVAEDGHQQTQRRLHYDALKNVIDPSPTQRRRFEAKGQHAYAQTSAASTIIATQHRDVVKLPRDDRRIEVLTCGRKMTPAETTEIRAWMADPENIGALHRALLATPAAPLDVFDPFGEPPPFAGRLEMIGMAKSRIEDAYEAAIDALEGFPLFTMTQAKRLIGYFGDYASGDWSNQALHTIAKNAYRLRDGAYPASQAQGDRLRAHGSRAAALAPRRQGDDCRGARPGGGAGRARHQQRARSTSWRSSKRRVASRQRRRTRTEGVDRRGQNGPHAGKKASPQVAGGERAGARVHGWSRIMATVVCGSARLK